MTENYTFMSPSVQRFEGLLAEFKEKLLGQNYRAATVVAYTIWRGTPDEALPTGFDRRRFGLCKFLRTLAREVGLGYMEELWYYQDRLFPNG